MTKNYPIVFALLLCCSALPFQLLAQRSAVRGQVTSSVDGQPVQGVKVSLNTGAEEAVTEKDGSYSIQVEQNFFNLTPTPTLAFSHPDYESQEVAVIGRKRLDITLRPLDRAAEQLFVTGLAMPIPSVSLPFAGGALTEEELQQGLPNRISTAIAGRVPGLRLLEPGGQAGQANYFQLRGINVLSGPQQPLVLVDGIFLGEASLLDFNPEDISRVEVLKGAAGAAAYGAQGANGVIQIFTKNGSELADGQTRISYRSDYGFSDVATSYPLTGFTNREVVSPTLPQPVLGAPNATNTYTTPLPQLQDYEQQLFQRRALRSHSLSVSGRSGGTYFLGSAQRFRDEGSIAGKEGYTRHAFRANLGHEAGEKFKARGSIYYISSHQDGGLAYSADPANLLANTLMLTPIFDLDTPNEEDGSPFDWEIDNTGARITNPLYLREQLAQEQRRDRLMGSFGGTYRPLGWLDFDYAATLDRALQQELLFIDKGYLSNSLPRRFGPLATAGVQGSSGGAIEQARHQTNYFTSTASLMLHKKWLGFSAAARAGLLYESYKLDYSLARGENLAVAGIRSLDNPQTALRVSSAAEAMTSYSAFFQADANYKEKYIFSGGARAEQSSLFGEDVEWPAFYRVAGAYRISEDVSMKVFQELKLRAAIGTAGTRPAYQQRFETYDLANGVLTRQTLANERLRPATTRESEIGIDATFLRAFTLSGTYVQSVSEGQLLLQPLSGGAGFAGQWRNAGTVEAEIYEASLRIDLKKLFRIPGGQFRWEVQATGQRVEQRITGLEVPAYRTGPGWGPSALFEIAEGAVLGSMVGEAFVRTVDQLASLPDVNILEYAENSLGYIVRADQLGTPQEVPVKLVDENGLPVLQPIGDVNPDFQIGIAHTFAFRGFELFALFDWRKGGDVYNYTKQQLYQQGRHAELGESPTVAATFFGNQGLSNGLVPNQHFVEDGSYFMLREAALSFTMKTDQLPFLRGAVEALRLSLIGSNLFTLTEYTGYHPALTTGAVLHDPLRQRQPGTLGSRLDTPGGHPALFAVDYFNQPLRRSFRLSLQITL